MDKPNYGKAIGGAFVVGGACGVVGQLLVLFWSTTALYSMGFSTSAALICMGLIGAILFAAGLYPKIEKFGGVGASLPFCGLAAAVSGVFYGVKTETKNTGIAAKVSLIEIIIKVPVAGVLISTVVAVLMYFTDFGTIYTMSYAPAGVIVTDGVVTGVEFSSLIWAFLVPAVICAIGQVIFMASKLTMPKFLLACFVLGALLTPFGVMQYFVELAGGGFQVLIMDGGEGAIATFMALTHGVPIAYISNFIVFAILWCLGLAGAMVRYNLDNGSK